MKNLELFSSLCGKESDAKCCHCNHDVELMEDGWELRRSWGVLLPLAGITGYRLARHGVVRYIPVT
jgi:hypothetical protein